MQAAAPYASPAPDPISPYHVDEPLTGRDLFWGQLGGPVEAHMASARPFRLPSERSVLPFEVEVLSRTYVPLDNISDTTHARLQFDFGVHGPVQRTHRGTESMQSCGVCSEFGKLRVHGTRVSWCQSWCGGSSWWRSLGPGDDGG